METKAPQFYFSHDTAEFQPEDLIESVMRYAVYSDGTISEDGEIVENLDTVSFGNVTPELIYSENGCLRSIKVEITDEFGTRTIESSVEVYIGVKGDANLDGVADAKDAAEILVYAAAVGAGNEPSIYSDTDETIEAFALWLAEVDSTGAADAKDAALVLVYAAASGSGNKVTWEQLLGAA